MMRLLLIAAFLAAAPAARAAEATQDWPCIQVRQPHLSVGQLWSGQPPDESTADLARAPEVAKLADTLAQRRITMEDAAPLLAAFPTDPAHRTALFVAVFDRIEGERQAIMQGISRFGHGQAALAAQIEERRAKMAQQQSAAAPDFDAIDAEEEKLDWDMRIFTERQQMLTAVCESPVLLEQRLFALGRDIATPTPTP